MEHILYLHPFLKNINIKSIFAAKFENYQMLYLIVICPNIQTDWLWKLRLKLAILLMLMYSEWKAKHKLKYKDTKDHFQQNNLVQRISVIPTFKSETHFGFVCVVYDYLRLLFILIGDKIII